MSVGQLLGLDVGTSAIKALVIDDRGQELGRARARTPWRTVSTGAEMSPTALLMSAVVAATNALEQAPRGLVCGVGVASMAETGVLLDRHGCPVVPAIAWHDSPRDRAGAAPRHRPRCGIILRPHRTSRELSLHAGKVRVAS